MAQQLNKVNQIALSALRKQRIIRRPHDLVLYTMLKNHPSLYKPDDVVYVYEHVMGEFKYNRMRNFNVLHPIVVNQQNVINYDEVNLMADILDNNNNIQQIEEYPEYGFSNTETTGGYGSNYNGGYDSN